MLSRQASSSSGIDGDEQRHGPRDTGADRTCSGREAGRGTVLAAASSVLGNGGGWGNRCGAIFGRMAVEKAHQELDGD